MIVALDNLGDLYLSVLQANTNRYTFCEYVSHLILQLDRDRPGWREDTVWQLDCAKWHLTEEVKQLFGKHQVPVVVSAPYSYDWAVVELFFAMWKRGELNMQRLAVTKSKSLNHLILP